MSYDYTLGSDEKTKIKSPNIYSPNYVGEVTIGLNQNIESGDIIILNGKKYVIEYKIHYWDEFNSQVTIFQVKNVSGNIYVTDFLNLNNNE
jgi:hypothetical protein